jgi:hypothetical protein
MRLPYISFFLILFTLPAFAQKMPDYGLHKIRITDTGKTIVAEVIPVTSMPDVKSTLQYYWYAANTIHILQGGFSGQLLNGSYREFYLNKNLSKEGDYKKGLKNGQWNEWTESGVLKSSITWDNGVKSGKFSFFNPDGSLKQSGYYRQNELNGTVRSYLGKDSVQNIHYKKGKIVPDNPRSFFKRFPIFKKKKITDKPHG